MASDRTTSNPRALAQGAVLPMRALPRFTVSDLLFIVRQMLGGTPAVVDLDPALTREETTPDSARIWTRPKAPPAVGIRIDDIVVAVTGHDRPAFEPAAFATLDDTGWPGGRAELARGFGHVEVVEVGARMGGLDHNHDRSVAVTVVAAAVARLVEVIGVVWLTSRRCLPPDRLPELIRELEEGLVPVSLWLGGTQREAQEDRPAALVTSGLYPLLGAEIEVGLGGAPGQAELAVARQLAEQVAGEIIEAGDWPEHGARLDFGRRGAFEVRHHPGGHGGEVPVLALVPQAAAAIAGAA